MSDWIITVIILVAIAGFVILGVKRGWIKGRRGAFTGMVVYHDWVNQDAQKGVEVIIKRNAGDQEEENESGEPDFEDMLREQDENKPPESTEGR